MSATNLNIRTDKDVKEKFISEDRHQKARYTF